MGIGERIANGFGMALVFVAQLWRIDRQRLGTV